MVSTYICTYIQYIHTYVCNIQYTYVISTQYILMYICNMQYGTYIRYSVYFYIRMYVHYAFECAGNVCARTYFVGSWCLFVHQHLGITLLLVIPLRKLPCHSLDAHYKYRSYDAYVRTYICTHLPAYVCMQAGVSAYVYSRSHTYIFTYAVRT